jgi:transcriptional regulator with XRE-family HTH domain
MDEMTLADFIRHRRESLGMTQADLAENVEMSQEWVSNIERGKIRTPRRDTMVRLAVALSVDLADLVMASNPDLGGSGSRRVAEAIRAEITIGDPLFDVVMHDARNLTPEGLEALRDIVRGLLKMQERSGGE